jgi:hypothetical protein
MFLVVNELPGGDQQLYDKVRGIVQQTTGTDQAPPGGITHVAGKSDRGWMVAEVWENQSAWEDFMENTLKPAFEQAGFGDRFDKIERRTAEVAVLMPA